MSIFTLSYYYQKIALASVPLIASYGMFRFFFKNRTEAAFCCSIGLFSC